MKNLAIIVAGMLIVLTACSPTPSKPSKALAQSVVDRMTYAKDARTGLCFGVVSVDSAGAYSSGGISATNVPCEAVKDHLEK